MGLRPVVPGLRVLRNSTNAVKVSVSVRPGESELVVAPYLAAQFVATNDGFTVDPAALAEGLAAEKAADEAANASDEPERTEAPTPATAAETLPEAKPRAKPVKKTVKKSAT